MKKLQYFEHTTEREKDSCTTKKRKHCDFKYSKNAKHHKRKKNALGNTQRKICSMMWKNIVRPHYFMSRFII